MIYLDHNATTQPHPEVVAAMREVLEVHWHNPSSNHRAGQAARRLVELARESAAELIGAQAKEITFTSGGTESIDLAIRGSIAIAPPERRVVVVSAVEHHAVHEVCEDLVKRGGVTLRVAPVDSAGRVRLDDLARLITDEVAIVSMQWANNEVGTVQPVHEIAALCVRRGVRFHCDATQWVGKMPARVASGRGGPKSPVGGPGGPGGAGGPTVPARMFETPLDCDLLTFSAHKLHGPKGAGVLWARTGTRLAPMIHGSQEKARRGGTENVPGIAGLGAAARLAKAWLDSVSTDEIARLGGMRDRFEREVLAAIPDASVNGPQGAAAADPAQRLWNTTNISFPRLEAEAILIALSERGVCASAGAACSSGSLEPSPIIAAMGVPADRAHGAIRFSICRETTEAELDAAVPVIAQAIARLRASMP